MSFLKCLSAKLRRPETNNNRPVLEDLKQHPLAPGNTVESLATTWGFVR
jgi:hypothetical protein